MEAWHATVLLCLFSAPTDFPSPGKKIRKSLSKHLPCGSIGPGRSTFLVGHPIDGLWLLAPSQVLKAEVCTEGWAASVECQIRLWTLSVE